jgi:hypothetical protein
VTGLQAATGTTAFIELSSSATATATATAAGTTAAAASTVTQGDYGTVALGVTGVALFLCWVIYHITHKLRAIQPQTDLKHKQQQFIAI